jgi:hypothetical protein
LPPAVRGDKAIPGDGGGPERLVGQVVLLESTAENLGWSNTFII